MNTLSVSKQAQDQGHVDAMSSSAGIQSPGQPAGALSPAHEETYQTLLRRIEAKEARVGVVGLGYVGLPLCFGFAKQGLTVLGFDVDKSKIEALGAHRCYIDHLSRGLADEVFASGHFSATDDFDRLRDVDAIIICVPTPLTDHRDPDMRYIEDTARQIASRLRSGHLVILESTTYPGTTDELVRTMLDSENLKAGENYWLAFSPEREDPGNKHFGTTTIPKVVGGIDERSGHLAERLYAHAIGKTVRVSSARVAEATKLTENIFRAVNIALVNELKMIYERMGIDVWEVLDACETKPFGFMRFNPGPGWGGHCIPLDPFYLTWKAREYGLSTRFIELAGEINVKMSDYVVEKLQLALNERAKPVKGSRILVLGLAYKKDISDARESPAFEIIESLLHLGAELSYHDPHVPESPRMRSWPTLPTMRSTPLTESVLKESDAVMIITDHTKVDYDIVLTHAPLIIDTRGVYRNRPAKVIPA